MSYAQSTMRWIAKVGYSARGLVFLTVGAIALLAALEFEQARDVHGALREINTHPGGEIVLIGLAGGLAAYGFWRLVQGLLDVDRHGWGLRALLVRGGLLGSAILYGSVAWACVKIALSLGASGGKPLQHTVSRTLDWPYGPGLVIAGGVIIAGVGIAHIHKAVTGGFLDWFDVSRGVRTWIDPICRVGLTARGLAFLGVSAFVIYAAITLEPARARGLEGVMLWIQHRIYGRIGLGALALGLMAFGCYSLIEACVRRVGLGPAAPRR